MARPIILGVVGDSAAGKTTLTRGLVRVLGEENVTHVCVDDYHRYDRRQRAERNITPLHPECNYMDIMAQHLGAHARRRAVPEAGLPARRRHLRPACPDRAEAVLGHRRPARLLHRRSAPALRRARLPRPPEELRRKWKVQRDCSRRGYTTDQVLAELDRREPDSAEFIRPQQRHADIVVSFLPGRDDQEHLDAEIVLRSSLKHPDLREVLNGALNQGIKLTETDGEAHMFIPGTFDRELAERLEETIWERLHFASHLRTDRLGEFTIGTELHRSEALALIQLLILYHLFTATASVALGGQGTREPENVNIAS